MSEAFDATLLSIKELKTRLHAAGISTAGCTEKADLIELFTQLATERTSEAGAMAARLFLVSDLHVNSRENWQWLHELSDSAFRSDALIVAGDVCEDLGQLEATLRLLAAKFGLVFFTPGNHDLWLTSSDVAAGLTTSLAKLEHILQLCGRLGVATSPRRFGGAEAGRGVWVCPLLSFHHTSFDTEPDVQGWDVPSADECMLDYRECVWPRPLSMHDDSVAAAVDALNDAGGDGARPADCGGSGNNSGGEHASGGGEHASGSGGVAAALRARPASEPLVSFSHFLPREELLPEKRFLFVPALPKASGSAPLGRRVAALRPTVHAFGHTHFGWDMTCADGVRYVQAALANPSERLSRWHTLAIGEFGRAGPLLLWDAANGFAPKMKCRWSGYYEVHPRLTAADGTTEFGMAKYAARFPRNDRRAHIVEPDFRHEGASGAAGARMLDADPVLVARQPGAGGGAAWPRGVWRTGANPL